MKSSLLDISNAFVEGEPLLTSVGLNLSNAINSAASRVSLLPKVSCIHQWHSAILSGFNDIVLAPVKTLLSLFNKC